MKKIILIEFVFFYFFSSSIFRWQINQKESNHEEEKERKAFVLRQPKRQGSIFVNFIEKKKPFSSSYSTQQ